ncbi:MAG: 30S ribosomal protein S21 [Patescibacteria group bacterium]|jgi:small subunit ribosomal protein S21
MIDVRIDQSKNKEEQDKIFDKAVRYFKKLCDADGFLKEIQDRRYYAKPSEKRRTKKRINKDR